MNHGDVLTRLSVWLALAVATLGIGLRLEALGRPGWSGWARWAWTVACGVFLFHVACAFHFFYRWSEAVAYAETARLTFVFTGINWGGGLYFNYLFAAIWLADVLWWWFAPASFSRRPHLLNVFWDGFFFFMVLNAAVVFVNGPKRWLGAALCTVLVLLWWRNWRRRRLPAPAPRF
jgi:hypothetical protein